MRTTDKETWSDTGASNLKMSSICLGKQEDGGESGWLPKTPHANVVWQEKECSTKELEESQHG